MSKRRHNFGTKRFEEKSLFVFHARIALKSLILLFVRLIARGAKIGKTHRRNKYCNPRACAPRVKYTYIQELMSRPKGDKERFFLTMSGSDTFLLWTFPQVGNLPLWSLRIRVKQAQRTACRRAPERVLFFRARDANSRIVNNNFYYTRSKDPWWSPSEEIYRKSERLRKQKAETPHRPAKRSRLFQEDQQETEQRQRRTFRKWRHNLAVYYAANSHGSCVNSAKSA